MPVEGLDHVAMPTADSERFLEFYKRLGFRFLNEERWRRGESRIFSLVVGKNNIINIHPEGFTASLRGETALPGCGDICCVWDGTTQDVLNMLGSAGVKPIKGPAPRTGGRGAGTIPSERVYIRDTVGNLLEFMVYSRD